MTPHYRRRAFSLVELLAVVGIIALLISILIPSLTTARTEANRGASKAFLGSIERGLDTFHIDFGNYPESRLRPDPIKQNLPGDWGSNHELSGAHWLARAIAGHDGTGVDFGGRTMGDGDRESFDYKQFVKDPTNTNENGPYWQRRGLYVDVTTREVFASDRDERFNQTTGGGNEPPQTGRIVLMDTFSFPILYYKANPRAQHPFSVDGRGNTLPNGSAKNDALGVYNHEDNVRITGFGTFPDNLGTAGWDFASLGAGKFHGLAVLGKVTDAEALHGNTKNPYRGQTFGGYLHLESAHDAGGVVKPVKQDSYVLISAGPDGVYGTIDDVSNIR